MSKQKLAQLLALANEFKEGDLLVGGTRDELERKEARLMLSAMRLAEITATPLVEDGLSEALSRSVNTGLAAELSHLTLYELKQLLLGANGARWAHHYRDGLTSEVIAAVVKLMTNEELSIVARAVFNPLKGAGIAVGARSHLGSRIQPNSPGDDEEEILFSILEGLAYGCGDVILGINPASNDLETIIRLEELLGGVRERLALPTRYCVLSDMVKQDSARARTEVDVGFQSLAGTEKAVYGMLGLGIDDLLDLARGFRGLYFETGQGSAVTNGAAEGVDMVTLEARAYGLARHVIKQTGAWTVVNDVAGFIGPEVFRTSEQLLRTCLEDTVMGKLHGLTMGLDVCSTFHMGIEPAALRQLTGQIVEQAAPAYLMAVAGNADPMLGYLTTSFREHPRLRLQARKNVSTAMQKRLTALGVMNESGELSAERPGAEKLYALYTREGGDKRSLGALCEEGRKKMTVLAERGFDLGYGHGLDYAAPREVQTRLDTIYTHARRSLYAAIDESVIKDVSSRWLRVRTNAPDREAYLTHPPLGERIREEDAARIVRLYGSRLPRVQLVISDGLNADAINENLRGVQPPLRRMLAEAGCEAGGVDIVIENGRVRAGYHVGMLIGVNVIIHLIGERPGTGLNMLSAYLTYGRDVSGQLRWDSSLDHSNTTAVCGIHRLGKKHEVAVEEIVRYVRRMLEEGRSGVEL